MKSKLIHVYLMPGMAANPSIFEYIKLPKEVYKIHWLEWQIPHKDESIEGYAKRMCNFVKHHDVVLLGFSFGGIIAQEMAKYLKLKKLFVVSSIKSRRELPMHLKLMKFTKIYKILPTQLLSNIAVLTKFIFGETLKKHVDSYKKYLTVTDGYYLYWSIKQMVNWSQERPLENAIYIQGDKDIVFPNSCHGKCIIIKGGTHVMIIKKYKWFNKHLPQLIGS